MTDLAHESSSGSPSLPIAQQSSHALVLSSSLMPIVQKQFDRLHDNEKSANIVDDAEIEHRVPLMIDLPLHLPTPSRVYYRPKEVAINAPSSQSTYKSNNSELKKQPSKSSGSKWMKQVHSLYIYFCKLTYSTGKNPTFDRINGNSHTMTVSKFVSFCRHFGIREPLAQLQIAFKKCTNYKAQMNYEEFLKALSIIAKQAEQAESGSQKQFVSALQKKQEKNQQTNKTQDMKKLQQINPEQSLLKLKKYLQPKLGSSQKQKPKQPPTMRMHGGNAYENSMRKNISNRKQYKFKLQALNGKDTKVIADELRDRKKIKSDNKADAKMLQAIKAKREEKKFVEFHILKLSDKKIYKGGYMSPSVKSKAQLFQSPQAKPQIQQSLVSSKIFLTASRNKYSRKGLSRLNTELNTRNIEDSTDNVTFHEERVSSTIQDDEEYHSYSLARSKVKMNDSYKYRNRMMAANQIIKQAKNHLRGDDPVMSKREDGSKSGYRYGESQREYIPAKDKEILIDKQLRISNHKEKERETPIAKLKYKDHSDQDKNGIMDWLQNLDQQSDEFLNQLRASKGMLI